MCSRRLNFDCLSLIVQYVDAPDVVDVCLALATADTVRTLIRDRLSPIGLFSYLVPNVLDLLYYMSLNKCVLSGSRAANYFFRGSCSNDSDWDFFVEKSIGQDSAVFGDMRSVLGNMGVSWETRKMNKDTQYECLGFEVVAGTMQSGRGKGQRVNLIASSDSDILSKILSFHSTPVQCFITYYGAVHLYASLSQSKKQLVWYKSIEKRRKTTFRLNDSICKHHVATAFVGYVADNLDEAQSAIEDMELFKQEYLEQNNIETVSTRIEYEGFRIYALNRLSNLNISESFHAVRRGALHYLMQVVTSECQCLRDTSDDAVQKYVERGYEKISFSEYCRDFVPLDLSVQDYDSDTDPTRRHIGDCGTMVVPFRHMGLETSNARIDEHIRHLSTCEWTENPEDLKMRPTYAVPEELIESMDVLGDWDG